MKDLMTSNGDEVVEITASSARFAADTHPYDETQILRADIMDRIRRNMLTGGSGGYLSLRNKQLDQSTVNWLIGLGYLVWHYKPFKVNDLVTEYSYGIDFRFPPDVEIAEGIEPFAPGERWADNYNEDTRSGAV